MKREDFNNTLFSQFTGSGGYQSALLAEELKRIILGAITNAITKNRRLEACSTDIEMTRVNTLNIAFKIHCEYSPVEQASCLRSNQSAIMKA